MARALFKAWFVDFAPVRAKAEGRDPGLPASLAELFPARLDDDGKPEGWERLSLGKLTNKIGSGATPSGGQTVYVADGIALIRSQNIYDHEFVWGGLARITDQDAERLKGVAVFEGDVLINITGDSILRTCVVDASVLPARVNQHVSIVRPCRGMPSHFLHQFLVMRRTKSLLLSNDAGGSRAAITKGHLEALPILFPGQNLLDKFGHQTNPLFDRINANRKDIVLSPPCATRCFPSSSPANCR